MCLDQFVHNKLNSLRGLLGLQLFSSVCAGEHREVFTLRKMVPEIPAAESEKKLTEL